MSILSVIVISLVSAASPAEPDARLLRFPDVHDETIVFSHGGDLWTVPVAGGVARRLTTTEGVHVAPRFSPDGALIAYTGEEDGAANVYVIPAAGGVAERLTYYPARETADRFGFDNFVLGWTPEGRVLFRGQHNHLGGFVGDPWTVSPQGGPVEPFPIPEAGFISFAPDGKRVAMTDIFRDFRSWKRYQGGMQQDVFIYNLTSKEYERITHWRGTDTQPMWAQNGIYFLSDRDDWRLNLWRYDPASKATTKVTSFTDFDVKWPHLSNDGKNRIVFENGGALYLLDTASGKVQPVPVVVPDDERYARPHWVNVADRVSEAALAPAGTRALVVARGDLFSVPKEYGDTRNLTATSGARERGASWSPDGKFVAYISDATGDEEIYVQPANRQGATVQLTAIQLTHGPASWHFAPKWSPDGKKLVYSDRAQRLFYVELASKRVQQIAHSPIAFITDYAFSPDSRWIAYGQVPNDDRGHQHRAAGQALFLYSLDKNSATQVTSEAYDSGDPVFAPDGKYLFFLSSRNVSPTLGNYELSYTLSKMVLPHALLLCAHCPSPFAPKSDEGDASLASKNANKNDKGEGKNASDKPDQAKAPFTVDQDGIFERVVAFPVPAGNLGHLEVSNGKVWWLNAPTVPLAEADGPRLSAVESFDLEERKVSKWIEGVTSYDVSHAGDRLLYRAGPTVAIVEVKEGLKVGDGALKLDGLRAWLDPRAEWKQIFVETWRLFRDFFYLPDMGSVDWNGIRKHYEPLLQAVTHRIDLNYVLAELVAELGTGHCYVGGGDYVRPEKTPTGVLGAELVLDTKAKRWRIGHLYPSQPWIESRRPPLAEAGLGVKDGNYLLAIDGHELSSHDEPYRLLVGTAGKTVSLTINDRPSHQGERTISVHPQSDEWDLLYLDWVEKNRQAVDRATDEQVGYVYLPNMGAEGLTEFIRQYYAQLRKLGMIIDVRSNGGGFVSSAILERLRRTMQGMENIRDGRPTTYPESARIGPLVAIIDQYSASDGDVFPWFFKHYGLGPVIGKRTWGGVVGINGLGGDMIDGGYTFVAESGIYDSHSQWVIENQGVSPDIEVERTPADLLAGKDAQLERAISEVQKQLKANPPSFPDKPASKDLRHPPAP